MADQGLNQIRGELLVRSKTLHQGISFLAGSGDALKTLYREPANVFMVDDTGCKQIHESIVKNVSFYLFFPSTSFIRIFICSSYPTRGLEGLGIFAQERCIIEIL